MASTLLDVRHVSKSFENSRHERIEAVRDVTLTVQQGEFVSLIGPSGCGKTTLLMMLAGLMPTSAGAILEKGRPIGTRHDCGVVFQHYSLFPWLNVEENIGFGLMLRGISPKARRPVVSHYLEVIGLQGFERSYPNELSGGMKQRVALARALATNPKILFLDEPFAALDVQTKRLMQNLLLQILQHEPRTVMFVTHDVEEAVMLSDVVYILHARPARIREKVIVDLPRPRDFEAEFTPQFIDIHRHIQSIMTQETRFSIFSHD